MVSFPGQKCVQIWITSNSQMPYLQADRQSLIFGLRRELKGVYVSEIIRVRHLKIKILCQPINIYESVTCPTAPFHSFPCIEVRRCLTVETDSISLPACFSLCSAEQSSFKTMTHFLVNLYSPFSLKSTRVRFFFFLTRDLAGLKIVNYKFPHINQLPKPINN